MTRSKKVTLNGGNELADFVNSSPVSLRVVAFEEINYIHTFYKNKDISWMEAIYHII